jgi:glycosyltransferase involved in cell wall biosynthesis
MSDKMTGTPNLMISVIIPTYNRKDSLLRTLESLTQQTCTADHFEVIVVDDGGSDGTDQIMGNLFPFRLAYYWQTNQGSAAARNYGAQQSHGNILVFIDDDITLLPEYLAEIAAKTVPGTISLGVWQPYEPSNSSNFTKVFARQVWDRAILAVHDEEVSFTECTSNNVAVTFIDFVRIGRWQDVLGDGPTLWGDVEFGYRAWKENCRFLRVANAKLIHRDYHKTNLEIATKRAYHVSRIVHPLFAKYPELQDHLSMFVDKSPVAWGQDSPTQIVRKLVRQVFWSRTLIAAMERLVPSTERYAPGSKLQVLLYRWIISSYIYHGYRDGYSHISNM